MNGMVVRTTFLTVGVTLCTLFLTDQDLSAQQPVPDQSAVICVSELIRDCSGRQDMLDCLTKNLAKLSEACRTAISGPPSVVPLPPKRPAMANTSGSGRGLGTVPAGKAVGARP